MTGHDNPYPIHHVDPARVDALERWRDHADTRLSHMERSQAVTEERTATALKEIGEVKTEQRDGFQRLERILERRLGSQTRWWLGIGTALILVLVGLIVDLASRI